jgi:hypothetical protein
LDGSLPVLMALAWLLVTLAIALIFRPDLTQALGRVGRLKYRDFEVTFQENLFHAEELARNLPPVPVPAIPHKDSIVFEIDPGKPQPFFRRPPMLNARAEERQTLLNLVERSPGKAIEGGGIWSTAHSRRPIESALHEAEARLVGLLQAIKDRADRPDGQGPSANEARRFVELACPLALRIEARG